MKWDELISYPKAARSNRRLSNLMDTLIEIQPIEDTGDRYSTLNEWLVNANRNGLLTTREYNDTRTWIADNL